MTSYSHSHTPSLAPSTTPSRAPSREPSPAPSLNTRVSRFSEQYGYEMSNSDRTTLFAQPELHEVPYDDKEALMMPGTRPQPAHSNSSDEERLLAQARQHADAEAGAYMKQR